MEGRLRGGFRVEGEGLERKGKRERERRKGSKYGDRSGKDLMDKTERGKKMRKDEKRKRGEASE